MISVLMELTNAMFRGRGTDVVDSNEWDETCRLLLLMLAPIAPHISEELWSRRLAARGEEWVSIHQQRWPSFDASLVAETEIELPIQINGKLRDVVHMPAGLSEIEIEQIVMSRDKVQAQLAGMEVVRVIHVRDRMVNVVVKPAR
ncbi:MAG TPA: class I tRNA ligase family protein, partial [Candidatus Limnocylindrales bacterium]|nr:class I tRNA ligase family protein [Candidatus Limnocylindrales bacterium]